MFTMAECTCLIGMPGLTLHQGVIDLGMTAAANLLWFSDTKGNVQRIMGVGMTAQTIFNRQFRTMAFLVMTLEA